MEAMEESKVRDRRPPPTEILRAAGMEIVRRPGLKAAYCLRDITTRLYKSLARLDSPFCWVREQAAAAKFRSVRDAIRVAEAYAGLDSRRVSADAFGDLLDALAMTDASPEEIIYPNSFVRMAVPT